MKFKSPIFAQASGSLGGTTYSHNKGGMYVRNRSTPINPASGFQQAVRNALKTLSTRWTNILTQVQRDAWKTYAVNVPLINKLGDSRVVPELAMYLRCNSPRLINNGPTAIVDDGPTTFSLATFTEPTSSNATATLHAAYENTDEWAIADGGYLFVYQSRPQNPAIQFFKGPYRLALLVAGSTMTPPTSPAATGTPPFPMTTGAKYFMRYNVSDADGRLSSSITNSFIAT